MVESAANQSPGFAFFELHVPRISFRGPSEEMFGMNSREKLVKNG
jgi:hypothetical protein